MGEGRTKAAESVWVWEDMFQLARRHNSSLMAFAIAMTFSWEHSEILVTAMQWPQHSVKSPTLCWFEFEVNCPSTSNPHLIVTLRPTEIIYSKNLTIPFLKERRLWENHFAGITERSSNVLWFLSPPGSAPEQVQWSDGVGSGKAYGQIHQCGQECHPATGCLHRTQPLQLQGVRVHEQPLLWVTQL